MAKAQDQHLILVLEGHWHLEHTEHARLGTITEAVAPYFCELNGTMVQVVRWDILSNDALKEALRIAATRHRLRPSIYIATHGDRDGIWWTDTEFTSKEKFLALLAPLTDPSRKEGALIEPNIHFGGCYIGADRKGEISGEFLQNLIITGKCEIATAFTGSSDIIYGMWCDLAVLQAFNHIRRLERNNVAELRHVINGPLRALFRDYGFIGYKATCRAAGMLAEPVSL